MANLAHRIVFKQLKTSSTHKIVIAQLLF